MTIRLPVTDKIVMMVFVGMMMMMMINIIIDIIFMISLLKVIISQ